MAIPELERKEIKMGAGFLESIGYTIIREDPYGIEYQLNNICIIIGYPPREEFSNVLVKFINENICFDVGWIAVVRKNLYTNQCSKLEGVLSLLMYIKENYDEITNISYCKDSDILIDEFIDNISKKND